jgi:hypothetical protein
MGSRNFAETTFGFSGIWPYISAIVSFDQARELQEKIPDISSAHAGKSLNFSVYLRLCHGV